MADGEDSVTRAVDLLTGTAGRNPLLARSFADPLLDAASVALAEVGEQVVAPDPKIEKDLEPIEAVITASGVFGWRVRLGRAWRGTTTDPLIAAASDGYKALLPGRRTEVSTPGRRARRLRGHVGRAAMAVTPQLPADTRWWRLVAWSLAGRRNDVWLLLTLGLIGGLAGLLLPLATGAVFQSAIPDGDTGRVVIILSAFAVGSLGAAVISLARGMLVVRLRDASDARFSPALLARLLQLRPAFFRSRTTGDVVNRALSVENARQQVDDNVVGLLITSVFGLVNLCYLLAADVVVGLVTTVAVAVVLAVSVRLQITARRRLPELLETRSRSDATLLAVLGSLVSWRVSGAEDRALARWALDQQASTKALVNRLRVITAIGPVEAAAPTAVLATFTTAVVLFPGSSLQPGDSAAPGVFLAMYAAVAQLSIAVMSLTGQLVSLSELGPTLSRATPIVTEPVEQRTRGSRPGQLAGALGLTDVVFGYREDRVPLFDGLSMSVEAGEFVAIVGPSGSGKSTLLRLLLGFETPWQGMVTFDGQDLAGLDLPTVRRQLGVVLQSSQPLGADLGDCVRGPRRLSDERVWQLLEDSGLAGDVRAMPMGLATPVGDRGTLLSGGQRQRLAIAAALASEPRVLLFDEATSALDNITQSVVMRTVLSYPATRFVIAHRMSTIANADRVLVVADGRIAEQGTPAQLLAAGGHFARLAARQEA